MIIKRTLSFFYEILGDVDPMQLTKVGLSGELTAEWETLKRNSEACYQQTLAATDQLRQRHAAVTADHEKMSVSRDQWRQRAETYEAILRRWPWRLLPRLHR